ncbi:MAG: MoaD/ThiS family protein [Granulosicoccaceae bacterium]
MKIGLKLMATISHLMPPGPQVAHKVEIEVDEGITLNDIIEKYKVAPELAHLVLVNGVYIEPHERNQSGLIKADDVVAIWPPVAGG